MRTINLHNMNPNSTFSLKMNHFGDLTNEEFSHKYFKRPALPALPTQIEQSRMAFDIPASVDWRTSGCVGPVVSEDMCYSSWAFALTASIEGALCAKYGDLVTLSAQQLIDCSSEYGNFGCEGFGSYDRTYEYIKRYGLESNQSYPYIAVDGACRYNKSQVIARCQGAANVTAGDELALAATVASVGPVAVVIDASHPSFKFYSGGLYYEPNCRVESVDQGASVVGYGSFGPNQDYFIVKNTWGTSWGDKGYIYMSRNRNNNCGIASYATYPIL